jgi:hypothetical protein
LGGTEKHGEAGVANKERPLPKWYLLPLLATIALLLFAIGQTSSWLGFDPLCGTWLESGLFPPKAHWFVRQIVAGAVLLVAALVVLLVAVSWLRRGPYSVAKLSSAALYISAYISLELVGATSPSMIRWGLMLALGLVNAYQLAKAMEEFSVALRVRAWTRRVSGARYGKKAHAMWRFQAGLRQFANLPIMGWLFLSLALALALIGAFTKFIYVLGCFARCISVHVSLRALVARPPGILYLGPSGEATIELIDRIRSGVPELRVVSLVDLDQATSEQVKLRARLMRFDNFRLSNPESDFWQAIVRKLEGMARITLIDGRVDSKWVRLETLRALETGASGSVILLVGDDGGSPIIEYVRGLVKEGGIHIPLTDKLEQMKESLAGMGEAARKFERDLKKPLSGIAFNLGKPVTLGDYLAQYPEFREAARAFDDKPVDLATPIQVADEQDIVAVIRRVVVLPEVASDL